MCNIGDRVGAVLGSDDHDVAEFLGYGVYAGVAIPEEAVGFFADLSKSMKRTNPKIELDNGKVVYGCECWWGTEAKIRGMLDKYNKVVEVDIDEVRRKFKEEEDDR